MTGGFVRLAGGCRTYASSILGYQTAVLENRFLRVTVLPERGGAIFEILWKPSDVDLLWRWDRGLRPRDYAPSIDLKQGNYQDHFFGGWDIMFPTVDHFQPVPPAPIGYHGEVALLPWRWQPIKDDREEVAIELTTRCVRSPFVVSRVLRLTPRPELAIDTSITNTSNYEVRYAIGEHIAFNLDAILPSQLQIGSATLTTAPDAGTDRSRLAPGQATAWPRALLAKGTATDISSIDANALGTSDVVGLVDLAESSVRIVPETGDLPPFSLAWDGGLMPALLIWFGLGGEVQAPWFGSERLLAIEPMSLLPWADPGSLPASRPNEITSASMRLAIEAAW